MGYDSKQGLYYNFKINDKELDWNPSFLTDLKLSHSIFKLFPSLSFNLVNEKGIVHQTGAVQVGNTVELEMGDNSDDEDMEIFTDFIMERFQITGAKSNLDSSLIVVCTHKEASSLSIASEAKAWKDKKSSKVVEDVVSDFVSETDIETTSTKGNWLKPNNQGAVEFLKILKNRSLPANSTESKMFMWIDLEGTFNFKSIEKMLEEDPVMTIDLNLNTTDILAPTEFDYINNGVRYNTTDTNESFKEYIFDKEGEGDLSDIDKPDLSNITSGDDAESVEDKTNFSSQPVLVGYSHSKLPSDYNKALYYNKYYNNPFRLSFTIKAASVNTSKVKPGTKISLIFPHHDPEEEFDTSLSGDYLVIRVDKREVGLQYVNDIYVVSNSQFTFIEGLS